MSAIVEVNHVSKEFRLGQLHTIKLGLQRLIARMNGHALPEQQNFRALDDVHFDVQEGEVLGIIGSNGAGKSTLLKILSRITVPSKGAVRVRGKVAPLIEVGAGLVGDLTGRENIYLNAAILGMSRKEITRKFDEIVAFSELEAFLETPVKRYSSGMAVRLGFSIATSVDADILIVDEVLAVGDLAFQRKCFDRMESLIKRRNKTVLLVSHNLRHVERMCTRAILLDHGRVLLDGSPSDVCDLFYARSDEKIRRDAEAEHRWKGRQHTSGEVDLLDIQMLDQAGTPSNRIVYNSDVTVVITCRANVHLRKPRFGIGVHTTDFLYLATGNSEESLYGLDMPPGVYQVRCRIKKFPFLPGVYALRLGIDSGEFSATLFYAENVFLFQVVLGELKLADCVREGVVGWDSDWSGETIEELSPTADVERRAAFAAAPAAISS
jgi:lipopolysaccharide transport system ATP-binding protein